MKSTFIGGLVFGVMVGFAAAILQQGVTHPRGKADHDVQAERIERMRIEAVARQQQHDELVWSLIEGRCTLDEAASEFERSWRDAGSEMIAAIYSNYGFAR